MIGKNTFQSHAIIFVGDVEKILKETVSIFSSGANDPDVSIFSGDEITTEIARDINSDSFLLPVNKEKRTIIIAFNDYNIQSQNILLKTIEDPQSSLMFIMISPSINIIIPTLKSRLLLLSEEKREVDIKKFINSSFSERLVFVQNISSKIKDEKQSKNNAIEFLVAIYFYFRNKDSKKLKIISDSIDFLNSKSSSVKNIMESLVINLD